MKLRLLVTSIVLLLFPSIGLHAGTHTVELKINEVTALADLVTPDNGSIKKGVVLITHGTTAHKDMELVESLQKLLAEREISSLAHSLTYGINKRKGLFDCAKPHTHKKEDALDEIGAWVAWLKEKGAGPVTLLGHSRSGNQTARYAIKRGGKSVEKLVLLAPSIIRSPGYAAKNYQKQYKSDLDAILKDAKALVSSGKPKELMSLPGFLYCTDAKAWAESVISYYDNDPRYDTPIILPEVKIPVLVIAGTEDTVVPDVAKRVKLIADGKKISLKVIDGADHMFLDFYIEDAADLIAAFLTPGS